MRIAVAVSRFNEEVTTKLLGSCLKTLKAGGCSGSAVKVVEVPGGYELPWTVQKLARTKKFDAVIALGCVLKGQTPQNDHIARSIVQHLHDISLSEDVPVVLGVMTPATWKQAVARTKGSLDRGKEAAEAALEMLKVSEELSRGS